MVRIRCADGARGHRLHATRSAPAARRSSRCCAITWRRRLIGRDPDEIEAIWKDLFFATHATAVGAITSLALAAIDTALWDLQGAARRPAAVEGGRRRAARRCRSTRPKAAGCTCRSRRWSSRRWRRKAAGFRGAKIKVGKPHVAEDVARLAAVREAVGDGFEHDGRRQPVLQRVGGDPPRARVRAARPRLVRGAAAGRGSRRPRRARGAHGDPDRRRRIAVPPGAFPRIPRARRLLDRAGRLRAHRRHHAVAQGGAPRRDVQRRGLPAFPDGAPRVADRRRAQRRVGRVHPAARRHHHVAARDRGRLRRRARRAGPRHRLEFRRDRRARRRAVAAIPN